MLDSGFCIVGRPYGTQPLQVRTFPLNILGALTFSRYTTQPDVLIRLIERGLVAKKRVRFSKGKGKVYVASDKGRELVAALMVRAELERSIVRREE